MGSLVNANTWCVIYNHYLVCHFLAYLSRLREAAFVMLRWSTGHLYSTYCVVLLMGGFYGQRCESVGHITGSSADEKKAIVLLLLVNLNWLYYHTLLQYNTGINVVTNLVCKR